MTTHKNNLVEPLLDSSLVAWEEIERARSFIAGYKGGQIDGDTFRRFRLQNGIYGIRDQVDVQMLRIKVPFGRLTAAQLEALSQAAETYAGGRAHVTTRQDIQLYGIPLACIPDLLADLGAAGLTTREASGNVARNVTADPLAGVARDEAFDVRPHANTVARYLLRNPISQNLPRKVKIAFSGSPADRAATRIHDIGAIAVTREIEGGLARGFQITVGGGLGSKPYIGKLLEDFTPEAMLLPTIEAIIRVFDRLGNREVRAKARLKFLVDELGIESIRELVERERRDLPLVRPRAYPDLDYDPTHMGWVTPPEAVETHFSNGHGDTEYRRWRASNIFWQRQPGFAAISVALPGGDISSSQLEGLAAVARRYAGSEVFTTIHQNLVLRWVPEDALHELYLALRELTLGEAGAHRLWNVTSCPGAETCHRAVTTSHHLALELARQLRELPDLYLTETDDLRGVDIRVSGCPNSCSQHHVAAIGFYGGSRRIDGRQVPHYTLLLGGGIRAGETVFGVPVISIPARRVPEVVERVVALYRSGRRNERETFHEWIARVGAASVKDQLADLQTLPDPAVNGELYQDWGQNQVFKLQVGEAECAM